VVVQKRAVCGADGGGFVEARQGARKEGGGGCG